MSFQYRKANGKISPRAQMKIRWIEGLVRELHRARKTAPGMIVARKESLKENNS